MKMFKTLFLSIAIATVSLSAFAKDKLYVLNPGSTGGSFNATMSAYAEDLKQHYDIEYVQGKKCANADRIINQLTENNQPLFTMWMTTRYVPEARVGMGIEACNRLPEDSNFVRADFTYGILYTRADGPSREEILHNYKKLKIGLTTPAGEKLIQGFLDDKGLQHTFVKYDNSNDMILAVLAGEVDFVYDNKPIKFIKQGDKVKGLYTFDPNGLKDVPSLSTVTKYKYASVGNANSFKAYNMSADQLDKFRDLIGKIHSDPNSNISKYYGTGEGVTNTLQSGTTEQGLKLVVDSTDGWTTILK